MPTFLSIRHLLGYSCLFLGWMIPDHIPPWNTFPQEATATLGIFLLWSWRGFKKFPIRIYAAAAIFAGAIAAQYIALGLELGDLIFGILAALIFCIAATIGQNTAFSGQHAQLWCYVLLAAALGNTVIGLAQWLHVTQGLWMLDSPNGRVYGNFAQPNHFATLLTLGIGSLIYLDTQKTLKGAWAHTAAFILVVGLAASESRTGALSFTIMVAVVAYFCKGKDIAITLRWLIPALILFWILYAFWGTISIFLGTSATRTGAGVDSSSRFELWMQMLEAIRLHPWIGYGWLHIGAAQNAVADYLGGTVNMDHAHNFFIDLLIWFGIPAAAIAFVAFVVWIFQIIKNVQLKTKSSDSLLLLLMITPIVIHSQLEYPFAYIYFLIVFSYFAGAIETSLGYARIYSNKMKLAINGFVFSGIIACLILTQDYLRIESDFRALRLESQFFTTKEQLHVFKPAPKLLTQYGTLINVLRRDSSAQPISKSVDSAKSVVLRFPWLMTYQHYYALLIELQRCNDARKEKAVIKSLFGRFGILKLEEEIQRQQLAQSCEIIETD